MSPDSGAKPNTKADSGFQSLSEAAEEEQVWFDRMSVYMESLGIKNRIFF